MLDSLHLMGIESVDTEPGQGLLQGVLKRQRVTKFRWFGGDMMVVNQGLGAFATLL
jgi:hypothetical protein